MTGNREYELPRVSGWLMTVQSLSVLVTIGLVVARAVNVLGS